MSRSTEISSCTYFGISSHSVISLDFWQLLRLQTRNSLVFAKSRGMEELRVFSTLVEFSRSIGVPLVLPALSEPLVVD